MKALKILMVVAALVVIAGLTTDAWAACPSAQFFVSSGAGGKNVRVTVDGVEDAGNAIGRFWDSDNWNDGHNGVFNDAGSVCEGQALGCLCPPINADPASSWWVINNPSVPGENKVAGIMTNLACVQAGCPSNLTVVVEDYATAGPPGVGDTAYYMAMMVDETGEARWWDLARVDGLNLSTTFPMLAFPDLVVTGSSRIGTTAVQIVYNNLDQTSSVHTWDNGSGAVFPTVDVIREWQLVKYTGETDPGRARSLGWTVIQRTPYVAGGTTGTTFTVPCDNQIDDEWVAVGIGFEGGTAVIDSALVGEAIALECNPDLANPEDVIIHTDRKPSTQELQSKPARSGGRR